MPYACMLRIRHNIPILLQVWRNGNALLLLYYNFLFLIFLITFLFCESDRRRARMEISPSYVPNISTCYIYICMR